MVDVIEKRLGAIAAAYDNLECAPDAIADLIFSCVQRIHAEVSDLMKLREWDVCFLLLTQAEELLDESFSQSRKVLTSDDAAATVRALRKRSLVLLETFEAIRTAAADEDLPHVVPLFVPRKPPSPSPQQQQHDHDVPEGEDNMQQQKQDGDEIHHDVNASAACRPTPVMKVYRQPAVQQAAAAPRPPKEELHNAEPAAFKEQSWEERVNDSMKRALRAQSAAEAIARHMAERDARISAQKQHRRRQWEQEQAQRIEKAHADFIELHRSTAAQRQEVQAKLRQLQDECTARAAARRKAKQQKEQQEISQYTRPMTMTVSPPKVNNATVESPTTGPTTPKKVRSVSVGVEVDPSQRLRTSLFSHAVPRPPQIPQTKRKSPSRQQRARSSPSLSPMQHHHHRPSVDDNGSADLKQWESLPIVQPNSSWLSSTNSLKASQPRQKATTTAVMMPTAATVLQQQPSSSLEVSREKRVAQIMEQLERAEQQQQRAASSKATVIDYGNDDDGDNDGDRTKTFSAPDFDVDRAAAAVRIQRVVRGWRARRLFHARQDAVRSAHELACRRNEASFVIGRASRNFLRRLHDAYAAEEEEESIDSTSDYELVEDPHPVPIKTATSKRFITTRAMSSSSSHNLRNFHSMKSMRRHEKAAAAVARSQSDATEHHAALKIQRSWRSYAEIALAKRRLEVVRLIAWMAKLHGLPSATAANVVSSAASSFLTHSPMRRKASSRSATDVSAMSASVNNDQDLHPTLQRGTSRLRLLVSVARYVQGVCRGYVARRELARRRIALRRRKHSWLKRERYFGISDESEGPSRGGIPLHVFDALMAQIKRDNPLLIAEERSRNSKKQERGAIIVQAVLRCRYAKRLAGSLVLNRAARRIQILWLAVHARRVKIENARLLLRTRRALEAATIWS